MRLLLFSDIHCNHSAIARIVDLAAQADALVGAGDFGTMRRGLLETVSPLKSVRKPTILVPGNAESDVELADAASWPNAFVLHGGMIEVDGISFYGLGGGIPITPFGDWSFDLAEDVAAEKLAACPPQGVLVTHSPPQGAVDRSSGGKHLGSTAIRDAIVRCEPRLAVCGHIHDSAGNHEKLGITTVINAGPEAILWDLENDSPIPQ